MYRVSPLTYLASALLSTGLARSPVECSDIELLQFQPPPQLSCGEYMKPYLDQAGGSLKDAAATDMCQLCPLATTDAFLQQFSISYDHRWRDYGIMWAYIVFNIAAAVVLYWALRVPKRSHLKS